MKTNVLARNPGYYAKKFQEDLGRTSDADGKIVAALAEWLGRLADLEDLDRSEEWVSVSTSTGAHIEDLHALIKPVLFMASTCTDEHVSFGDLLDDLTEAGVLADHLGTQMFRDRLSALGEPLTRLTRQADNRAAPSLPLLYLKSIRTRCVAVSEFDREFDIGKDEPSSYHPAVRKLHPRVTLELTFKEDEHERVGILLTPKSLQELIKWLQLAETQLHTIEVALPGDSTQVAWSDK